MSVKKSLTVFCALVVFSVAVHSANATKRSSSAQAQNIIFMVSNGLGISGVTAARILKNGPNGEPLAMEDFPHIGYQRTHSASSTVTDSAAAASAWACGEKFQNKEISCHSRELKKCIGDIPETILEVAQKKGKATGLVVTSEISHATPAAFAAHCPNRYCGAEIARQFVSETQVDVLLGGGLYGTKKGFYCQQFTASWEGLKAKWDNSSSQELFAELAKHRGYKVVKGKSALKKGIETNTRKLLGLFNSYNKGKTPELFRLKKFGITAPEYPQNEPTLPEMTQAALKVLEKESEGFFLMVEGSQIDWANHSNDDATGSPGSNGKRALKYQLAETLAFNQAVQEVQEWILKNLLARKTPWW